MAYFDSWIFSFKSHLLASRDSSTYFFSKQNFRDFKRNSGEETSDTKEICSGKCHEKGDCQHMQTQEIVELIWAWDAFKREVISPKPSWRLFCKKGRKPLPKNKIWLWLWKSEFWSWGWDHKANMKKDEVAPMEWLSALCITGPNPFCHTSVKALPGLPPCQPASQPTTRPGNTKVGTSWLQPWLTSLYFLPANPTTSENSRQMTWSTHDMTWLPAKSYRKNLNRVWKCSGSLCSTWKKSTPQDLYDTPRQASHSLPWTNLDLSAPKPTRLSTPRVSALRPPGSSTTASYSHSPCYTLSWVAHLLISHLTYATFLYRFPKEISNLCC